VVEGRILVADALDAGAPVDLVLLGPDGPVPAGAARAGVRVARLADGVLERIADTTTPQPVLAVVRRPSAAPAVPPAWAGADLVVVLAGVADPGNVGTILRAAEAAGADAVVATGGTADLYGPKTVRASGGALFRMRCVEVGSAGEAVAALRAAGLRVLGADAAGTPHDGTDLTVPLALVVGREVGGLPEEVDAHLDGRVGIPMAGGADSLNAAMAATVLLFEAARQRRAARPEPSTGP
jgi:TrmH family RNA methyltransferase